MIKVWYDGHGYDYLMGQSGGKIEGTQGRKQGFFVLLEEDEKRFNIIGMAEVDCLIYEEGFMGNDEALVITDKDGRHDSIKITKCSQIFIDDLTGNALKIESDNQEKSLSQRERTSLLHIIGCLLDAINGNQPFEKHQSIASEAELIAILVEKYSEYQGISKSNLEKKLAEAKKLIRP